MPAIEEGIDSLNKAMELRPGCPTCWYSFPERRRTERIRFMLQRRWLRWTLVFAGWTCAGLFFASQTYLAYKYSGGQAHIGIVLKLNLADWYLWGLLAPGIIWLGRRFPLERGHWARSTVMHLIAGVGIALLKWWLGNLFRRYVLGLTSGVSLAYVFHGNLLTYSILVAATQGYLYYQRYRRGELRSAQLSAQLAQAQVQALRMQLHPHFLFNTLNSIATLIHKDPDAADQMTARLSDLLRLTLENIGVQDVPLAQELEFLERYLEIEKTRFSDRLVVRIDVAPETLDASTPYLILQPLVENAIRHGIAARSLPGCVIVRAARDGGMLVLEVKDDGPGIRSASASHNGIGISSTRARLEKLYGDAHIFELNNAAEGGLEVKLAFPFRLMPPPANASNKEGGRG
jgi:two-component system, LytTR family, sensor kinase